MIPALEAVSTGVTIVPRKVLGGKGYKAPSDTLNIACVGIDGEGSAQFGHLAAHLVFHLPIAFGAIARHSVHHLADQRADRPEFLRAETPRGPTFPTRAGSPGRGW